MLTDKDRDRFGEILTKLANGQLMTRAESKEAHGLLAKLSQKEIKKENNMREKILKLFEVSHSNEIYMSFVDLMCEEMKHQSDDAELADKAVAAIKTVIATEMPALNEQFVQLYADTYNEEEIDAMIAYHTSPVGLKAEAMRKHLTAEGARISQGIQPKIMAAIQQVALDNLLGR